MIYYVITDDGLYWSGKEFTKLGWANKYPTQKLAQQKLNFIKKTHPDAKVIEHP